jgi:hypothetical protein
MEDLRENAANKADVLQPFMFHYPSPCSFFVFSASCRLRSRATNSAIGASFRIEMHCLVDSVANYV